MIKANQVIVVIPCKNEEKTLEPIYKKLKAQGYGVLIPLARKSSDGTKGICERNRIPYFLDSGKGKGAALREAIGRAGTPYLVFFDADGSHDENDIPAMVAALEHVDMVIGSRLQGGSLELYDGTWESFFRTFFTIAINQIVNARFGSRITDTQNGFRAARTESLRKLNLRSDTFEIETEMVMKMLQAKMKIAEVPAREYPRKFGGSGVSLLKHGWRYVLCVTGNLL